MTTVPEKHALQVLREMVEKRLEDERRLNKGAQSIMMLKSNDQDSDAYIDAVNIFNATCYRSAAYQNVIAMIGQVARKANP